jgi:hypothetical protein
MHPLKKKLDQLADLSSIIINPVVDAFRFDQKQTTTTGEERYGTNAHLSSDQPPLKAQVWFW